MLHAVRRAAIDVPAGDRAAVDRVASVVAVLEDGKPGWLIREYRGRHFVVRAFVARPAVIAAALQRRLVIDLFPAALADVGDDERAGSAQGRVVERELPRIAHAERPDFRSGSEQVAGRK